jgi:poly-D-alanine transfer protein DltD
MRLSRYLATCATALALCALAIVLPAAAQTAAKSQKEIDIAAARAQRKAIVAANMQLTDQEAKGFWPLYQAYEAKMDKLDDRHAAEIKEYAKHYETLTDSDAKKKLDEVMAIKQARLNVQKQYIPKFTAVLSPIKVTRFFQIDNKLRAMVQCDIAQIVPLARPGGSAVSQ